MKNLCITFMGILFFMCTPGQAQITSQKQYLDTGDHVPDVVVHNVSNYSASSFKLSDFKGKLVVLDFWDRTCVSCIKSFPVADSLQKQFKDNIQWILVTRNTQQEIDAWFSKLKKNPVPKLVSVTGDTVFSSLFYYRSVPHLVVIDPHGKVAAITTPASATAQNISALLNGGVSKMYYNNQVPLADIKDPWNEVESPYMEYFSCLMRRVRGRSSGGSSWLMDPITHKRFGYRVTTSTILELYKMAWGNTEGGGIFSYNNQVILEVANPSDYFFPADPSQGNQWIDNHCYEYAIRIPVSRADEFYSLMRQDLNRYFNINAWIEKRKLKCLLLVRTSTNDRIKTVGKNPVNQHNDTGYTLKNYPVSWLIYEIAGAQFVRPFNFPYPIVDNTGYTGNIDIDLHVDMKNIPALKKELNKYDLDLVEGEKELDVLVLREKNFGKQK